ncbi:hypothetical protein BDY21DRAFT_360202 [Lineolata rhizophorae]|uniref:Uncharacterized protein n=1 Tax=Lineolata rhizophorae TaxID=578093 RepID=A0A6A6PFU1_9PEZI|nr:hypothetical protein BDY21DRAFT_360202 [Lineolata rhizophorae]
MDDAITRPRGGGGLLAVGAGCSARCTLGSARWLLQPFAKLESERAPATGANGSCVQQPGGSARLSASSGAGGGSKAAAATQHKQREKKGGGGGGKTGWMACLMAGWPAARTRSGAVFVRLSRLPAGTRTGGAATRVEDANWGCRERVAGQRAEGWAAMGGRQVEEARVFFRAGADDMGRAKGADGAGRPRNKGPPPHRTPRRPHSANGQLAGSPAPVEQRQPEI